VFEHAEFAGASATLTRDTPDFRSIDLDNRVSSLRVAGREAGDDAQEDYQSQDKPAHELL
jgi:hypothetical protein